MCLETRIALEESETDSGKARRANDGIQASDGRSVHGADNQEEQKHQKGRVSNKKAEDCPEFEKT